MSLIQKLLSASVAAVLALALVVPMASASGWRLERANSATPYTGPVTLALSSGTVLKWIWSFPSGASTYMTCVASTASGSITDSGSAPSYIPAGTISSWSASGAGAAPSCTASSGAPFASWVGTNVPWNVTVGTFGVKQAKLAIQNPVLKAGVLVHTAALLEGRIVNPPNGTQTARVQFNDANDALGLNNSLTSAGYGTLDLQAEYTLTGVVAGSPQNLKVTWVP